MSSETPNLRIGTRASPLARTQTAQVAGLLEASDPALAGRLEISALATTGDRLTDAPLRDFGGKGLFTKELDDGLTDGRIDIAVHSMKDVATALPDGIVIAAVLPREDPRDAFISLTARTLADLPPGARVGTSGLRRAAQVKHFYPHLDIVPFRGNVATRLGKLKDGQADATLLAMAGLNRLDMVATATAVLDPADMLPAVAQGAIGIACREDDTALRDRLAALNDATTAACIGVERAFLAALDGSCRTPIAGWAQLDAAGQITFTGRLLPPDGRALYERAFTCPLADAIDRAVAAADDMLGEAGPDVFREAV